MCGLRGRKGDRCQHLYMDPETASTTNNKTIKRSMLQGAICLESAHQGLDQQQKTTKLWWVIEQVFHP